MNATTREEPVIKYRGETIRIADINDPWILELWMRVPMKWYSLDDETRKAMLDRYQHLNSL